MSVAPDHRPHREREIVSARAWQRRLRRLERMPVAERREFEDKRRLELSVEDLRDEAIARIRNELGRGEVAFQVVHARGGAHPRTLQAWENKQIRRPQMPTLRASLRAIGCDLGIVRMGGANDV